MSDGYLQRAETIAPGTGAVAPLTEATPPRTAAVLIASTRAAAGVYLDKTGPLILDWLRGKGFSVTGPVVRADGEPFARALVSVIGAQATDSDRPNLVITSGGTGISPTDVTPQVTAELLDYEIPGLAEALRRRGADAGIATAVLSRGLAGVAGRTLVVNLPGSSGGVKDGIAVLDEVLDHALDQLAGGDHARPDAPSSLNPPHRDVGESAGSVPHEVGPKNPAPREAGGDR